MIGTEKNAAGYWSHLSLTHCGWAEDPCRNANLSLGLKRRYQLILRRKQLDKMERDQDQVVYLFPAGSSEELGCKG
jgi:hypothetical protein